MSTKIFISYSHIDEEFAKELEQIRKEIGIEDFLDRKDIDWGDHIVGKVQRGLLECPAVVVIVSPASLKSQWVPFEIGHAMCVGKKVLPLLTHPSLDLPDYLKNLSYKTSLKGVKHYFENLFESMPETKEVKKMSLKERDKVRAERNEMVIAALRRKEGITNCSVFQLEDHTDKGYLLYIEFDEALTSAAEVLSILRETLEVLFADIPYWGEMKSETENSVGFAYTYIDQYNKLFR